MIDQLGLVATRFAYASSQLPRMAWYAGLFYVMRQLAQHVQFRESGKPLPQQASNTKLEQRLNAAIARLIQHDLANVEAGIYPVPADRDGSLFTILSRSRLFFQDLPDA